jgi:hypothetical protein
MKVIIDIRTKSIEEYPFKTAKLGKVYFPRVDDNAYGAESLHWDDFSLTDGYFGGNIHKIAALKNKPYYIIVSNRDETIGILHRFQDLSKYEKKDLFRVCDNQNIIYFEKDTKADLIDKLTALQDK